MKKYDNVLKPRRDALIVDSTEKLLERNLINFDNTRQFSEEEDAVIVEVIGEYELPKVGSAPFTSAFLNDKNPPRLPLQAIVMPKSLELIYPETNASNISSLPLAYVLPGTSYSAIEGQTVRIRFIDGLRNEAIIVGTYEETTPNATPQSQQSARAAMNGSGATVGTVGGPPISSNRARPASNSTTIANQTALNAVQFFVSKGWTPEQACGIVGNLQAESGAGLAIGLTGDRNLDQTAFGIAQWRDVRGGLRQSNFSRYLPGKTLQGPPVATREEQLGYVQWELDNTENKAANLIKNAKTPSEAAAIVDKHYERSSGKHVESRKQYAETLYKAYVDANPPQSEN